MQTKITPTIVSEKSGFLTEKIIQKVTMGFLKTYYKYRPRMLKEPTVANIDMRTKGGIVADGFYSFKKPDGKDFLVTFEATSYHTNKEVTYKMQTNILLWDGLAIAGVLTVGLFAYGLLYNKFTINDLGVYPTAGLIIFSVLFFTLLYRLIGVSFSRYRYIYAIEQFKKYHADEQWIAIGHDVFGNPLDKRLKELKNQCVYNGFGLLSVDRGFKPQVLITPAREEIFSGKRKNHSFKSGTSILSKLPTDKLPPALEKMSKKLVTFKEKQDKNMSRFSGSYYHQMLVVGISLLLIGVIFFKEMADAELIVLDKDEHIESVQNLEKGKDKPEQIGLLQDTSYSRHKPTEPQQLDWWIVENEKNLKQETNTNTLGYTPNSIVKNNEIDVLLTLESGEYVAYDCERFMNFVGKKYLVKERVFTDFQSASARMQFLASKNLISNILNLACFSKSETEYTIFFNQVYNSERDALHELDKINFAAEEEDLDLEELKVITIYLEE